MNTNDICIYCGSPAYGPSCPFSPHKKHVHMSNPKRCCYCGSSSRGPGCPFNPFTKVHVHGVEYNQMIKDSANNSIVQAYLIKKLSEPITDTKAYQLKLVNEDGIIIKKPETVEEMSALTSIDKYIFDLKTILGDSAIGTINNIRLLKLEENTIFDPEKYKKELALKAKVKDIVLNLNNVIQEAIESNVSSETFEKMLIEVLGENT